MCNSLEAIWLLIKSQAIYSLYEGQWGKTIANLTQHIIQQWGRSCESEVRNVIICIYIKFLQMLHKKAERTRLVICSLCFTVVSGLSSLPLETSAQVWSDQTQTTFAWTTSLNRMCASLKKYLKPLIFFHGTKIWNLGCTTVSQKKSNASCYRIC